jgi:hypothetical protein
MRARDVFAALVATVLLAALGVGTSGAVMYALDKVQPAASPPPVGQPTSGSGSQVTVVTVPDPAADRVARFADGLAAATLVLAIVAGVIAFIAYRVSVRRPRLKFHCQFGSGPVDRPVFDLEREAGPTELRIATITNQLNGRIWLENESDFAAHFPAVRIDFIRLVARLPGSDWLPSDKPASGATGAVEWTPSSEIIIHGKTSRPLPALHFDELSFHRRGRCRIKVTVLADGYRKTEDVRFATNGRR